MNILNTYEIHYLHKGIKKVALYAAASLTDIDAWKQAALASGVSSAALPNTGFLSLTITAVESQGITKVRWNLSPKAQLLQKRLN